MHVNRMLDILEYAMCRVGIRRFATWDDALGSSPVRLYAGKLSRDAAQYATHWGITPYYASRRNIWFDVSKPYPIPDGSVDVYQSEDVFEHVEWNAIVPLFDEIHRVLKSGGLFRLSVPDYHGDICRTRTQLDANGELLFDPGGGGRLENGRVVGGGHVWFPTIERVRELFDRSRFGSDGEVHYLQYTEADGTSVMNPIDYSLGHVQRTAENDPRVADRPRPISIVVDAVKR